MNISGFVSGVIKPLMIDRCPIISSTNCKHTAMITISLQTIIGVDGLRILFFDFVFLLFSQAI